MILHHSTLIYTVCKVSPQSDANISDGVDIRTIPVVQANDTTDWEVTLADIFGSPWQPSLYLRFRCSGWNLAKVYQESDACFPATQLQCPRFRAVHQYGQHKTVLTNEMKLKQNWNKIVLKLFKNCFFSQAVKSFSCLVNHSRYPLFMQYCCLWCCQL